jgi:hypothetical protein
MLVGYSSFGITEQHFLKTQILSFSELNYQLELPLREQEVHNNFLSIPIV